MTGGSRAARSSVSLTAAMTLAGHGLPVLPLKSRSKEPATRHGVKDATVDGGILQRRLIAAGADCNLAVATGSWGFVLDSDGPNAKEWLKAQTAIHGALPKTWTVKTSRGGHLYFRCSVPVPNVPKDHLAPDVEIKGIGGYVVCPPSVHPDGHLYEWLVGPEQLAEPADAPSWLTELLIQSHQTARSNGSKPTEAVGEAIPEGQRNQVLASLAGSMRRRGMTERAILAALVEENAARCVPPLTDAEVCTIAHSVGRYDPQPSWIRSDGALANSTLPEDFWSARRALQQIRQAAHHRGRSADAVLAAVLTRIAAGAPHQLKIPPIVGSAVPLCLLVILVGPPGSGKSSAYRVSVELVPLDPTKVADQLPIGSGEGLVEALFDMLPEKDREGKAKLVKSQVFHNAAIYADEGQVMTAIGGRNGSVLLPTLRTIFTGGTLGQTNAERERKRIVPAGRYTYGVVAALQDELAGALLGDEAAGTPQRFLWFYATDPTIPDVQPAWPGTLDSLGHLKYVWNSAPDEDRCLEIAQPIQEEVRAADLQRSRGQVVVESMQAHSNLLRLKLAACLTILDRRTNVTAEDWQLAGTLKTTSDTVLALVQAKVAEAAERAEEETSQRLARREVTKLGVTEGHRIGECAERIRDKVTQQPGRTRKDMYIDLRRWRDVFDDGLEQAIAEGWIHEREEPGQGASKRVLYPGKSPA